MGRPISEVLTLINEGTREPAQAVAPPIPPNVMLPARTNRMRLVAKEGTSRPIEALATPIGGPAGDVIGAVVVLRDVSDTQVAEAARAQLAAIVESLEKEMSARDERHQFLADLTAATDPLTDADEVMATTVRMLGEYLNVDRCVYAEVENEAVFIVTGEYYRGVPSILGRWQVAAFGVECQRCLMANEAYVIDDVDNDPRAGKDLEPYRATTIQSVICVPLHKADRFTAVISVQHATVRRWTEDEIELVRSVVSRSWETIERTRVTRGLKEAAERLSLAFDAALLGDWSWDAATDLVTLSPRAAEIFGVPQEPRMTWTAMQGILHHQDRESARLAVERSIAARDQYDTEYRVTRPNGQEVWISAKGRAQYLPKGAMLGMFGVVQDITEKKRLEQELRQRAVELAEADRKKDDFIALLAHELRNPLAPIRTGLQVMRMAGDDTSTVAKARDVMDRQLSHMVRLIDDLLDVSRMGRNKLHLQKTKVLLSEVIGNACEAIGPAVQAAGHTLTVELPPEPVTLEADLTRLAQVFGNLLSNAVKYTEPGGRIWVTAELSAGEVPVSVKDNGIGIPTDALPEVFDMFSQVDRSIERVTGGLGIGLALVKGLVEAHGGTVWVETPAFGNGSIFTVRLPTQDNGVALAGLGAPVGNIHRACKRVLVVDDNQDAAQSMAQLLTLLGNEAHVAHDGATAIEMVERMRPDLVLMDIGMPVLGGLDATQQIRRHAWGQGIRIIALTGWGQDSDKEKSRIAGCDGHLVKPVDIRQVEKILADMA